MCADHYVHPSLSDPAQYQLYNNSNLSLQPRTSAATSALSFDSFSQDGQSFHQEQTSGSLGYSPNLFYDTPSQASDPAYYNPDQYAGIQGAFENPQPARYAETSTQGYTLPTACEPPPHPHPYSLNNTQAVSGTTSTASDTLWLPSGSNDLPSNPPQDSMQGSQTQYPETHQHMAAPNPVYYQQGPVKPTQSASSLMYEKWMSNLAGVVDSFRVSGEIYREDHAIRYPVFNKMVVHLRSLTLWMALNDDTFAWDLVLKNCNRDLEHSPFTALSATALRILTAVHNKHASNVIEGGEHPFICI